MTGGSHEGGEDRTAARADDRGHAHSWNVTEDPARPYQGGSERAFAVSVICELPFEMLLRNLQ